MNSTALGAERAILFISEAHEKFYYEKLKEVRYQDVYHKALVYCLGVPPGISEDEIMKAVESCVQNQKDELMKILDVEE